MDRIVKIRVPDYFYNYRSVSPVASGTNITAIGVDGEADTFLVNNINFISSKNNVFVYKERGGTVLIDPAVCFLVTESGKEFISCMVYLHTKRTYKINGVDSVENHLEPLIKIFNDDLGYFDKITGLQGYFSELTKSGKIATPKKNSQITLPFSNSTLLSPPKVEQTVIKYI